MLIYNQFDTKNILEISKSLYFFNAIDKKKIILR